MKTVEFFVVILTALIFSSCATLNKSECLTADWQMIGLEDGTKGRTATYLGQHRKACAEYGVTPDLTLYQSGHQAGLVQFCTEHMGFLQGKQGKKYNGVCPAGYTDDFLEGYNRGRELYVLHSDINRMHSQVKTKQTDLTRLNQKIQVVEYKLISGASTSGQRQSLVQDLTELQTRKGQLESKIHYLQIEAARKKGEYDVLSTQYGY